MRDSVPADGSLPTALLALNPPNPGSNNAGHGRRTQRIDPQGCETRTKWSGRNAIPSRRLADGSAKRSVIARFWRKGRKFRHVGWSVGGSPSDLAADGSDRRERGTSPALERMPSTATLLYGPFTVASHATNHTNGSLKSLRVFRVFPAEQSVTRLHRSAEKHRATSRSSV